MRYSKESSIIFGVIASLVIGITLMLFLTTNRIKKVPEKQDDIACTMEALVCPDGSSVERAGPNCEFAQCPQ